MLRPWTRHAVCPGCGTAATVGAWREPFGKFRWGMELSVTAQDLAVQWPLCAEHADALLTKALDCVAETLTDWGLRPGHDGLQEE